MNYVKQSLGLAACVSLAGSLSASCSKDKSAGEGSVIELGLMVEYADASDTETDIARANMAAREINDGGGLMINGQTYELRVFAEDHGGTAEGGVAAIERMS
jgi:ABC-type branched-subunit amino acid transport system substrate-binding protein